jgi:competence protein ComEC
MAKVHILNVAPGDCTLIQHNSGRISGIDICCGHLETRQEVAEEMAKAATIFRETKPLGNYRMCERPSNPINYMKTFGLGKLFRFILSHPDMDHMDGLANLKEKIGFYNFWHTGHKRDKPDFGRNFTRYREEDWDLYEGLVEGRISSVTVLEKRAGDRFALANKKSDDNKSADALYILAPDKSLVDADKVGDDVNESSYVIQYHSGAGPMIFPGDAHNASWDLVMKNNADLKGNCSFLLAPHHGRDSDRSYDFLDFLQPKLTVLGCAPSKYLAYDEWSKRGLLTITSNQAGNIVLHIESGYYDVYIENKKYAEDCGGDPTITNNQGYYFWRRIKQ